MKYTRTLIAVAWLTTASMPPVTEVDAAPAPEVATEAPPAPETSDARRTPAHEPWFADYPATTHIDGALVYAADAGLVDDVAWALDRFAAAGLDLPDVEVWMHDDPSGCRGSDGVPHAGYLTMPNDEYVIYSCGTRFTLLHELAHVWDHHALTDDVREQFLALRGLEVWGGAEWRLCGGEHLANVIAWGVDDQHTRPTSTEPSDDASLEQAFRLATGIEPPA